LSPASRASSEIGRSLRIQQRVIGALFMREVMTRYGRHNIGFLWLFVEPMIFTLFVTGLWNAAGMAHGSDLPITAFAVTGYSTVLLWRNMPARCIGSVEPNLSLMYHRNVRVIDVFLSRLILEAAGATISFITLTVLFVSLEMMDPPEDIMKVIAGWLLTAWFGFSLAIILGSLAEEYEMVERLWHPISYIMFPLSGAAFLVSALPPRAQELALYLPMINGVELVREGFFGSKIEAHYDVVYLVTVNSVLLLLGLAQTARVNRKITLQ
jgi:ABC-type polysaccharide/polyol phosphate export permease